MSRLCKLPKNSEIKISQEKDPLDFDEEEFKYTFIARWQDEPVGHGSIFQPSLYHPIWILRDAKVAPRARGLGIQDKLIKARLAFAKEKGGQMVKVWVRPNNSYSLNNLIKNGFIFLHEKPVVFKGVECIPLWREI